MLLFLWLQLKWTKKTFKKKTVGSTNLDYFLLIFLLNYYFLLLDWGLVSQQLNKQCNELYVYIKNPCNTHPGQDVKYFYSFRGLRWWVNDKISLPMQETRVQYLGQEDPLE